MPANRKQRSPKKRIDRGNQVSKNERVRQIGEEILAAFQEGRVPEAVAKLFITPPSDSRVPSVRWSWSNRLHAVLMGHRLAAGFRQWEELGRKVKKGEKAFYILRPWLQEAREDDPESDVQARERVVVGFAPVPVFGYDQTEGRPLAEMEEQERFLDSLPLVEVARSWGLAVVTFVTDDPAYLGHYRYGKEGGIRIAVAVENPVVWAHELVHAADHRLKTLTEKGGQQLDNEVVAQLGASILLEALGLEDDSDRGTSYRYIETYCKKHGVSMLTICNALLERTCAAVSHLLETAQQLASAEQAA